MVTHLIHHTTVNQVANDHRLQHWLQFQKAESRPVYYVLPSRKWLFNARRRRSGLAFTTFDDVARALLQLADMPVEPLTRAEADIHFHRIVTENSEWPSRSAQARIRAAKDCAQTYSQLKRVGLTIEDLPLDLVSLRPLLDQFFAEVEEAGRQWYKEMRILKHVSWEFRAALSF